MHQEDVKLRRLCFKFRCLQNLESQEANNIMFLQKKDRLQEKKWNFAINATGLDILLEIANSA
jgi:hypothetical protein